MQKRKDDPEPGRVLGFVPFPKDEEVDDTKYSSGTLPFMILFVPFVLILLYGFLA